MDKNSHTFPLTVSIPDYLIGEVQSKLAYVDEDIKSGQVAKSGDVITLVFKRELTPQKIAAIEKKALRVVEGIVKNAFKPKVQILEDHMDREVPYRTDPMDELIRRGELSQEARGIFTIGPLLTRLIDFFESEFMDLAESFGAEPYRFPTLIPASYLEKVNYFHAFPHSLTFATHLREDLDVIQDFSDHASCDEHGIDVSMDSFSKVQAMLSPAVCYHLYFALADKPLTNDQLVATAVGNCFRYESSNLVSLERLWNFTMREIIFVGSREFVLENRETARKRMEEKFARLGFAYRVETANDPFFVGEFKQAAFQNAFQLKFEIRASLPFKNSTLAVGSYNYHQDFFGRNLKISLSNGKPAQTGCVAFGLERIAYAFLAQYGLDLRTWPKSIREVIS
jgi:seryl-tRNA synthetase